MIKDSRDMYGAQVRSPEGVRQAWDDFIVHKLSKGRPAFENRPDGTEFLVTGEVLDPYVSDSRWVADCPACNGGIACWIGMADAACFDCGRAYTIKFPSASIVARAEIVLSKRPQNNRHWKPNDETVDDLKAENAINGFDFTEIEVA